MSIEPVVFVIDRFESHLAVLVGDDGAVVDVPRTSLPAGARSGSVLSVPRDTAGAILWSEAQIDEEATAQRSWRFGVPSQYVFFVSGNKGAEGQGDGATHRESSE